MSDKPSHMGGQVVETCLTEATKQTSVTFMRGKGDNTTDTADGTTEYIYIQPETVVGKKVPGVSIDDRELFSRQNENDIPIIVDQPPESDYHKMIH